MITAVKSLGKCNNSTGYYRRDEGEKKENITYNSTEILGALNQTVSNMSLLSHSPICSTVFYQGTECMCIFI